MTNTMLVSCALCASQTAVSHPDVNQTITPVCKNCRRWMARQSLRYWNSYDDNLADIRIHVPMPGYNVTAF